MNHYKKSKEVHDAIIKTTPNESMLRSASFDLGYIECEIYYKEKIRKLKKDIWIMEGHEGFMGIAKTIQDALDSFKEEGYTFDKDNKEIIKQATKDQVITINARIDGAFYSGEGAATLTLYSI